MQPTGFTKTQSILTRSEAIKLAYDKLNPKDKATLDALYVGVVKTHPLLSREDFIELTGKLGIFLTERGWL